MADDVKACLSWAHPSRTGLLPVGEALAIVIVFLFADMQDCEVILMSVVWWMSEWQKPVAVVKLKSSAMTARVVAHVPHCGSVIIAKSSGWLLHH